MANRFKAPIRVSVDTAQVKALVDRIQGLDKRAGRAAVKKGLNETTKLVLWDARAAVPKRTGMLRKSLGRKVIVQRGGTKLLGIVKPRSGEKYGRVINGKKISPIRYAHLVEFGRAAVRVKTKTVLIAGPGKGAGPYVVFGKSVRAVPPRPFMRPAWEKNEPQTVPTLHRYLEAAIRAYWKKTRAARARRKS